MPCKSTDSVGACLPWQPRSLQETSCPSQVRTSGNISRAISWENSADTPEDTSFGDAWRSMAVGGLKAFTVSLEANQDYAAGGLDAAVWPLFGTQVALVWRATDDPIGASNPEYRGQVIPNSYNPIGGSVGDLATAPIGLQGTGPVTRATS